MDFFKFIRNDGSNNISNNMEGLREQIHVQKYAMPEFRNDFNIEETPDEEPTVKYEANKYGIISEEFILHDEVEDSNDKLNSIKKYGIPDEHLIVSDYAVPFEPSVEPTAEPTTAPTRRPGEIVSMYAYPRIQPSVEPTAEPTIAPTARPTVAPVPTPTFAPSPSRPVNPFRVNLQSIILNLFGGENSIFAQRVLSAFNNFFSRWQ